MRRTEVILDGKTYTITELRSRANAAWRKRFQDALSNLTAITEMISTTEVTNAAAITAIIQQAIPLIIQSPDLIRELLIAYVPELKDAIENAYDSEIVSAFIAVLGLAFPFGQLGSRMMTTLGSATRKTGPSSA